MGSDCHIPGRLRIDEPGAVHQSRNRGSFHSIRPFNLPFIPCVSRRTYTPAGCRCLFSFRNVSGKHVRRSTPGLRFPSSHRLSLPACRRSPSGGLIPHNAAIGVSPLRFSALPDDPLALPGTPGRERRFQQQAGALRSPVGGRSVRHAPQIRGPGIA